MRRTLQRGEVARGGGCMILLQIGEPADEVIGVSVGEIGPLRRHVGARRETETRDGAT